MKFLGHSALTGLNSALDTYVSQAAGAKNYILCGVFLNRARFILIAAFIPVTFLFCNVQNIMEYFGQNAEASFNA
jgi:Na+-driven multidrug efflux pump